MLSRRLLCVVGVILILCSFFQLHIILHETCTSFAVNQLFGGVMALLFVFE